MSLSDFMLGIVCPYCKKRMGSIIKDREKKITHCNHCNFEIIEEKGSRYKRKIDITINNPKNNQIINIGEQHGS